MECIYTLMPNDLLIKIYCEFLCSEMTEPELYEFIILFKYSLLIGF